MATNVVNLDKGKAHLLVETKEPTLTHTPEVSAGHCFCYRSVSNEDIGDPAVAAFAASDPAASAGATTQISGRELGRVEGTLRGGAGTADCLQPSRVPATRSSTPRPALCIPNGMGWSCKFGARDGGDGVNWYAISHTLEIWHTIFR